jgi:hypothetical protein
MTRHTVLFSLGESPWHATLLARFAAVSTTEVLTPESERLPLRLRAFGRLARAAGRLGALASPGARALVSGLNQRRMLGQWAVAALPSRPRHGVTVVAPSLAAREVFARAHQRGLRTALFLDLPHLLALHVDLDRAMLRFPEDGYLRHFRAPAWAIARQRAELELADEVLVRGDYAASAVTPRLRPQQQLAVIAPAPSGPLLALDRSAGAPLLLAGPAAGRSGFAIAAAAATAVGRPLLARRSAATEPHYLSAAAYPAVRWLDGELPAVAAVLAPALCEAFVHLQAPVGLPIVGSERADGVTVRCASTPEALVEALTETLNEARSEEPSEPPPVEPRR